VAYEEISKVHKGLGQLIKESFELRRKFAREFSAQKFVFKVETEWYYQRFLNKPYFYIFKFDSNTVKI